MTSSSANERVYNSGVERLRSPERIQRLEVGRVRDLCLQEGNVAKLLDVGTGSALFAEAFFRAGVSVAGVDTNPEMIAAARVHLPQGDFHVAPAESLPFADTSFDATFFGVVFHEVSDYQAALREAYRVSRHSTFILEWQYRQEEFGPPLEHRVTEDFIRALADSSGYRRCSALPLTTLMLYVLRKHV